MTTAKYDCLKCPGYCCSYPVIELKQRDLKRLAKHFDITPAQVKTRFTKRAHGHDCIMRRKQDPYFGRICRFFDTEARHCSIYAVRPETCRAFPGEPRCGYYDFLKFERRHQADPDFVATTNSGNHR